MYINQIYKYQKDNIVYVSANVPEGAKILETMNILNAENGFNLIRKSDNENVGINIWLKDGDVQENYEEKEKEDDSDIVA